MLAVAVHVSRRLDDGRRESDNRRSCPRRKPGTREPETFVAVAALIVSLSALGVGVYEASLQRSHDRAEVWPHLEVEAFAGRRRRKVEVENTGLGPAVVEIDRGDGGRARAEHTGAA